MENEELAMCRCCHLHFPIPSCPSSLTRSASVQHPIAATILGVLYVIARLLYFQGYSSAGPKGRQMGM